MNDQADSFRHLSEETVYQGYIWSVARAEFEAPDGSTFERDIVRSSGAVAAIPLWYRDGVPMITMVRQYRPPFDRYVLEIPAGVRDVPDEPTVETARRELIEEIGVHAAVLELLAQFYPSAGMTDSILHVFVATELTAVSRDTHGPEEDDMQIVDMSLDEAVDLVETGIIHDAKSIIGILMVHRRLHTSTV